jgi:hypothetical protein
MAMNEQLKLAYEFASTLSRELITLAVGILALSVTFAKDIIRAPRKTQMVLLATSWGLYLISILAGISSLMGLTGSLAPLSEPVRVSGISEIARDAAKVQVIVFASATLIFIIGGVSSLVGFKGEGNPNSSSAPGDNRPARKSRKASP